MHCFCPHSREFLQFDPDPRVDPEPLTQHVSLPRGLYRPEAVLTRRAYVSFLVHIGRSLASVLRLVCVWEIHDLIFQNLSKLFNCFLTVCLVVIERNCRVGASHRDDRAHAPFERRLQFDWRERTK